MFIYKGHLESLGLTQLSVISLTDHTTHSTHSIHCVHLLGMQLEQYSMHLHSNFHRSVSDTPQTEQ